jgi:tellurite resistance protein TerC
MRHDNINPDDKFTIRLVRRFYPVTTDFRECRFTVQEDGVRKATPLLLALVLVESSDVTFAIDSIPAIFAITRDPFLIFTSNVFAILGLRSLYFVLAGLMEKFRYLKISLVFLLAYIGVKMMLVHHYPIPNLVSLAVIGGILAVGVLASVLSDSDGTAMPSPLGREIDRAVRRDYRHARNAAVLLLASSALLAGVAMLVWPGPALFVFPVVLGILAVEVTCVVRWLRRMKGE